MPITINATLRTLTAAATVALGVMAAAQAADTAPAALVEDVTGTLPGVQPLDYLAAGQTLSLAPGQVLSISYLASCVTETITGGTVTVGAKESTVNGGLVERTAQPSCGGGKLALAVNEAGKAGVTVFRSVPAITVPGAKPPLPAAQVTLLKTRPVLALSTPGPVTIERLDEETPPLTVEVAGSVLDMAKGGTGLVPGALYRISAGEKFLIVQIDPQAKDEGGPALGRLLRF